jgi:hypothetical protein
MRIFNFQWKETPAFPQKPPWWSTSGEGPAAGMRGSRLSPGRTRPDFTKKTDDRETANPERPTISQRNGGEKSHIHGREKRIDGSCLCHIFDPQKLKIIGLERVQTEEPGYVPVAASVCSIQVRQTRVSGVGE